MKRFTHILLTIAAISGIVSCTQKDPELAFCSPLQNVPINVVINWDSVPSNQLVLPRNMTVHWYPVKGSLISTDMGVHGGRDWLDANIFDVMCMDFNGNSNLAFRSNGTRNDFEAYNIRMTGTYNTNVPQLPGGEVTVAEAYPYHFYIDSRSQEIDTETYNAEDTVTVHFYPKNVLREFTFMVYDVKGAENMTRNGGAISGMSGSYYPATFSLATTPSTILFQRVEPIADAQKSGKWTAYEKSLFAAKNPNWENADTLIGWTRDWVVGRFVTFGPLDRDENRFRLTVEAFNQSNSQYHGAWGYWHGQWENTVAAQIDSTLGKFGTIEEQLAWRQRNGGYDIILYNDNRLNVPKGGDGGTDGGFDISVGDWGPIIEVPTSGDSKSATYASSRALVNTYETIPDFVINGIWTKESTPTTEWYRLFNEQYVYKPEGSSTIWDYSPKKYWNPNGQVDFYAYAPAGVADLKKGLHDNGGPNTPPVIIYSMPKKIDGTLPPTPPNEPAPLPVVSETVDDLLVAVQYRTSPQLVAVPITFRHAFSRVNVKAKIADADYNDGKRIRVTRADLRSLSTRGSLALNKDNGGGGPSTGIPMDVLPGFVYNGAVTLWDTNPDSLANYRFKLMSTVIEANDDYAQLVHTDDEVFVIPQVVNAESALYIEYNIYTYSPTEGEQYVTSATKLINFTSFAPTFAFEIGRQYVFKITLEVP